MKLLVITDAWEPQTNGVVSTLTNVITRLEEEGVEVTVLEPNGFRTFGCPGYGEIRLVGNPWRMGQALANERADAIHIATEGPLGLAARNWLAHRSVPFTTSLHTKFPEYVSKRLPVPLSWGYAFLRWFHRPASRTLVTTESHRRELDAWGLSRLVVWGRGVDTELFRPLPRAPRAKPRLLYVGRISVEKNIEAFLGLDIDAEKVLVGDGPQRAELERKHPTAKWLGYRHGMDLVRCYADADVFVFPSRTDTFGLVMLEAMACGTPVAAYPVTGPIDVVTPETGTLHEDLATAVTGALKVDRTACRNHALHHNWHAIAARFREHLALDGNSPESQQLLGMAYPPPRNARTRFSTGSDRSREALATGITPPLGGSRKSVLAFSVGGRPRQET